MASRRAQNEPFGEASAGNATRNPSDLVDHTFLGERADPAGHLPSEASSRSAIRLRSPARRKALRALFLLMLLVLLPIAALAARLAAGPISLDFLAPHVAEALQSRAGGRYLFALRALRLEHTSHGLRATMDNLTVRSASSGRPIIGAPEAEIVFDPLALLRGDLRPTRLNLIDIDVQLLSREDGTIAISAGSDPLILIPRWGERPPPDGGDSAAIGTPRSADSPPFEVAAKALCALIDEVAGPDPVLGNLEHAGVSRGRLILRDPGNEVTTFDELELTLDRADGTIQFGVAANGPNGRWKASASAKREGSGARQLDVVLTDVSLDEIALLTGIHDPTVDIEAPLSATASLAFDPSGRITAGLARTVLGAGYLFVRDRDFEPVQIEEVSAAFRWNAGMGRIDLERAQIAAGPLQMELDGWLAPAAKQAKRWTFHAESAPGGQVQNLRPGGVPLDLGRLTLDGAVDPEEQRLTLDRLQIAAPKISMNLASKIEWGAKPRHRWTVSVERTPVSSILRLWPSALAPPVRVHAIQHLLGGTVEKGTLTGDFDAAALEAMQRDAPPPDDAMKIEFAISGGVYSALTDVPAVSGIEATAQITGRTARIALGKGTLDLSAGKRLTLADGTFRIEDSSTRPTPALLNLHVLGTLDAAADLLGRESLRGFGGIPLDVSAAKGQADVKVALGLKLGHQSAEAPEVRAAGTISGLTLDRLVGKERLEQGNLNLVLDNAGLRLSGQGRLFGTTAQVELRRPPAGATEATLALTLDEVARSKLGVGATAGITGPVGAKVSVPNFGVPGASRALVELDLGRTGIDGSIPGFVKAAGKPAKASFTLESSNDRTFIDQLAFDSPSGPSARGTLELDGAGNFRNARLSSLRLSPGDDMKVDAEASRDLLKVTVRASAVDARPFLKALIGADHAKDSGRDFDLDLKTAILSGHNKQAMTGVELHMGRRKGLVRTLSLQARMGRASVAAATSNQQASPTISLTSADGGALLSFLDLYKRMDGGRLQLAVRISDSAVDGAINVADFIVRDEPALRRLVTESVTTREANGTSRIDTTAARFQRLSAQLSQAGGRLTVRDGVLYGVQIGIKLEGFIDFLRDSVDLSGTFVPAYGLNNLFSQVPLFGPLLGGGKNEGLFAVTFRISGAASGPMLTVNPLSAIAPGFLRKIFGIVPGAPGSGVVGPAEHAQ